MQYMVLAKLGMIDTYMALIFPSIAAPMNLFLMRQSMTQVPDAMIEAAKVDGAGIFRICWQIVMPNQKPALMTVIIFSFQAAWNIQGGTLVFQESLKTLPPSCSRQPLLVWREQAWQWQPPSLCWCRRSSSSCWHSGRSLKPWHIPESRTKGRVKTLQKKANHLAAACLVRADADGGNRHAGSFGGTLQRL